MARQWFDLIMFKTGEQEEQEGTLFFYFSCPSCSPVLKIKTIHHFSFCKSCHLCLPTHPPADKNRTMEKTSLEFFDANCRIGQGMTALPECAPDTASLLAELDRVGVLCALVSHLGSAAGGAVFANAEINRFLADDTAERLAGVWSFLPDCCPELPAGDELFTAMAQNRVRAFELQPKSHRWVLRRTAVARRFAQFAERRIPLIVRLSELYTWDNLYAVVERFPENIFIFADPYVWGCDRIIRPLLSEFPNFYFELGEYWNAGGLADLVQAVGSKRILFGSNYPVRNHGQQMFNIRHAEISEYDKHAIAGANLARLMAQVQL